MISLKLYSNNISFNNSAVEIMVLLNYSPLWRFLFNLAIVSVTLSPIVREVYLMGCTDAAVAPMKAESSRAARVNKEAVEAMMRVLSSKCKAELEAALGSQMELSHYCRGEIQQIALAEQDGGPNTENANANGAHGKLRDEERKKDSLGTQTAAARQVFQFPPRIIIVAFIVIAVVLFVAISLCMSFANPSTTEQKKMRKMSKKKVHITVTTSTTTATAATSLVLVLSRTAAVSVLTLCPRSCGRICAGREAEAALLPNEVKTALRNSILDLA